MKRKLMSLTKIDRFDRRGLDSNGVLNQLTSVAGVAPSHGA